MVDRLLENLHPYIDPDMELITAFKAALEAEDPKLTFNILDLSNALNDLRTMQAYDARFSVPREIIPAMLEQTRKSSVVNVETEFDAVNEALLNDLGLSLPQKVAVPQFLKIVQPYRNELSGIIESLISDSTDNGQLSLTKLAAQLADLNQQLLELSQNKKLLTYRATTAFIKTNRTLLATGLLAGTMGLTGNLLGCGATVLSGVGIELAKRRTKLKMPGEVRKLGEEVAHSIRPTIHRLLANYLDLDIRAVQLWGIKERIHTRSESNTH